VSTRGIKKRKKRNRVLPRSRQNKKKGPSFPPKGRSGLHFHSLPQKNLLFLLLPYSKRSRVPLFLSPPLRRKKGALHPIEQGGEKMHSLIIFCFRGGKAVLLPFRRGKGGKERSRSCYRQKRRGGKRSAPHRSSRTTREEREKFGKLFLSVFTLTFFSLGEKEERKGLNPAILFDRKMKGKELPHRQ